MPNPIYVMQNSFAGGEFSTALDGRQDLDKYSTGLKTMKNFFATTQGGAANRAGTHFISAIKNSSKKARLIPFVFSETTAYVLEFGDYYIRFYKDGAQLQFGGSSYEIVSPYSENDIANIKFTQLADVLYIAHPNYSPRTLSRYGDTNWVMSLFDFKNGPFATINLTDITVTPSASTGTVTLTASSSIFNSNMVGSLFKLEQDVGAQVTNADYTATGTTPTVRGMGTWSITTHSVWTGKL
ncbi:MAG: hypothetical protein RLY43_195, partial [Bacteroidota bacterium]